MNDSHTDWTTKSGQVTAVPGAADATAIPKASSVMGTFGGPLAQIFGNGGGAVAERQLKVAESGNKIAETTNKILDGIAKNFGLPQFS